MRFFCSNNPGLKNKGYSYFIKNIITNQYQKLFNQLKGIIIIEEKQDYNEVNETDGYWHNLNILMLAQESKIMYIYLPNNHVLNFGYITVLEDTDMVLKNIYYKLMH